MRDVYLQVREAPCQFGQASLVGWSDDEPSKAWIKRNLQIEPEHVESVGLSKAFDKRNMVWLVLVAPAAVAKPQVQKPFARMAGGREYARTYKIGEDA